MNDSTARKLKTSSLPPEKEVPRRRYPSRRDSDTSHLVRMEEKEKEISALFDEFVPDGMRLDEFRAAGGKFQPLLSKLLEGRKFYDKEKFINELSERMEKFPQGKYIMPFVASIAAVYEYIQHQDLAIQCADMCIKSGNGNFAMASVYSMHLSKITYDAAVANVPQETQQKMISKTLGIMDSLGDAAFDPLRIICEVSRFAESLRPFGDEASSPRIDLDALPLPDKEPFLSFLLAFENVCWACGKDHPALKEFCSHFIDLSKGKTDLFLSAVSVLAWSARQEPFENAQIIREVLAALRSWDLSYLKTLEKGLKRSMDIPG